MLFCADEASLLNFSSTVSWFQFVSEVNSHGSSTLKDGDDDFEADEEDALSVDMFVLAQLLLLQDCGACFGSETPLTHDAGCDGSSMSTAALSREGRVRFDRVLACGDACRLCGGELACAQSLIFFPGGLFGEETSKEGETMDRLWFLVELSSSSQDSTGLEWKQNMANGFDE